MTYTVNEVMDRLKELAAGDAASASDLLLFGDKDAPVTGIAVAFMPTQAVLESAAEAGANLIVSHEAPFYNHHAGFEASLADDPVWTRKRKFMAEHGLHLFRCHDYAHAAEPDLVTDGLVQELEWQPYLVRHEKYAALLSLPSMTVRDIARHVKEKLGAAYVRIVGSPGQRCVRVGMTVGYRGGGALAIPLFREEELDLLICGEGPEWETPEYVRDAVRQGGGKALLMLGHGESEQPGMKVLARYLRERLKDAQVPVHFMKNESVFQLL